MRRPHGARMRAPGRAACGPSIPIIALADLVGHESLALLRGRRFAHRGHAHAGHHRRPRHAPGSDDAGAPTALRGAPRRPEADADARASGPRGDVGRFPAAADAPGRRLGRAVHRGLGVPADVRARDDRRRHGARRVRDGRRHRARDGDPARHAGGPRRGPGGRRRRTRGSRHAAQRAGVRRRARRRRGGRRPRRTEVRHGVRRELLRPRPGRVGGPRTSARAMPTS